MSSKPAAFWSETEFSRLLDLKLPVIQAPMAGGASTPELVASVSNSGCLGSMAAALLSPEKISAEIALIKTLTSAPFGVNLFVLKEAQVTSELIARDLARLQPFRAELGLPTGTIPHKFSESFEDQLEAVIAARPQVVSFTFGIVSETIVERIHLSGGKVIGTATSVAEAQAWEAKGADMVCAQGAEAGGHRGTFIGTFEQSLIGTLALVPQVVDSVKIPVVAAGGIMDGRGVAAAFMLGASGVQLGTAFLSCPEAGAHRAWKERVMSSRDTDTRLTRTFSGRPARGIVNNFIERMREFERDVPTYPVQNALTSEIRAAATRAGNTAYMSMWAGQAASLSRGLRATDLIDKIRLETEELLLKWTQGFQSGRD